MTARDPPALGALTTVAARTPVTGTVVAASMIAALLASAWLLLTGVAVLALINAGVGAAIAVLPVIVVNAALALLLRDRLRREAKYRKFRRMLRSLRGSSATGRA